MDLTELHPRLRTREDMMSALSTVVLQYYPFSMHLYYGIYIISYHKLQGTIALTHAYQPCVVHILCFIHERTLRL